MPANIVKIFLKLNILKYYTVKKTHFLKRYQFSYLKSVILKAFIIQKEMEKYPFSHTAVVRGQFYVSKTSTVHIY